MTTINNHISNKQANWIADLLESGHTHYELGESIFRNAFYKNGIFVEEMDNREDKKHHVYQYSREEFIHWVMASPRNRFSRFLDMVN